MGRNAAGLLLCAVLPLGLCACIAVPRFPQVRALGAAEQGELDPRSIRVLTWNVYKSKLDGWGADFGRLAAEHDLLLLQEGYWDTETEASYRAAAGVGWWMGVTFEYTHRAPPPTTGTVLGSRSRPAAPVLFFYSPYREALVGTPKSHIGALFALRGSTEKLLAISVHGTNLHPDPTAFERHVDQILGRVALHDGPVVMGGDFNTWSEGRTAYLFERAATLGLTSVFDRGPVSEGANDGRMSWCDNYLDHAFVRGATVQPGARVRQDVQSSDHAPLSFELAIPRTGPSRLDIPAGAVAPRAASLPPARLASK